MNQQDLISMGCDTVAIAGVAIQTDKLLQYISLGLTILSILIGLIFKVVSWYKTAKADGKITDDELEELKSTLQKADSEYNVALKNYNDGVKKALNRKDNKKWS